MNYFSLQVKWLSDLKTRYELVSENAVRFVARQLFDRVLGDKLLLRYMGFMQNYQALNLLGGNLKGRGDGMSELYKKIYMREGLENLANELFFFEQFLGVTDNFWAREKKPAQVNVLTELFLNVTLLLNEINFNT